MILKTSLGYEKMNGLYSLYLMFTLVPFIACDLHYYYNNHSKCKDATFPSGGITLGLWMFNDAYIKLAVIAMAIFLTIVRMETHFDKLITSAYANLIRLYCLFNIAWSVAGGVLYFKYTEHILCFHGFSSYTMALLICDYIFSIFGLVIACYRPT